MDVIITAKLKLTLAEDSRGDLREASLAYRDAMNHVSTLAFEHDKTTNERKLRSLAYGHIRDRFHLPAQMAQSAISQVAASYRGLWTNVKQNAQHLRAGWTKKRYKGLDRPPKFVARTLHYVYGRDYSVFRGGRLTLKTLAGRVDARYTGYTPHLKLIEEALAPREEGDATPRPYFGGAKLWYDEVRKRYYLLVSIHVPCEDPQEKDLESTVGADVGRRFLAVATDTRDRTRFVRGGRVLKKAGQYNRARKTLQRKGTRSAVRRLRRISGRERRFRADAVHSVSRDLVETYPRSMIGLEDLTHIRERTEQRHRRAPKATKRQRRANREASSWNFAAIAASVAYKAGLAGSVVVKVDADYTSQQCPRCGHRSKGNRPDKGLLFVCEKCGFTLHADLVGGRNITMRTWYVRQDWAATGRLSTAPDATDDEAKAARLARYAELRWSRVASRDCIRVSESVAGR